MVYLTKAFVLPVLVSAWLMEPFPFENPVALPLMRLAVYVKLVPKTKLDGVNLAVSDEQILAEPPRVEGMGDTVTLIIVSGDTHPLAMALMVYITVSPEALAFTSVLMIGPLTALLVSLKPVVAPLAMAVQVNKVPATLDDKAILV